MKLGTVASPIQPGDLPDKDEIEKMLYTCSNSRDCAFIAVSLDERMRVCALASSRIKNVASGLYGVTKNTGSKKIMSRTLLSKTALAATIYSCQQTSSVVNAASFWTVELLTRDKILRIDCQKSCRW